MYVCMYVCMYFFYIISIEHAPSIILFTTLLYSIYSVNFTIFHTLSYYCTVSASIYYHNSLFFFCLIYPSFVHFYFNVYPTLTITVLFIIFFCKLSKSIDSIYSLNTFLCFVISSNLFTGHFFVCVCMYVRMCIYMCMHICIYVYIYICVCVCVWT